MDILLSNDIEYEIQKALEEYFTIYCRPLPEKYTLPNLLVTQVGGNDSDTIDLYEVVIDSRAETEGEANAYLRNALAVLKVIIKKQETVMRTITTNSSMSWGKDPVRPDLAMCSARVEIRAHLQKSTINRKGE